MSANRFYPELYAVVGANVPNYQGMFLRGHGSQNHVKNNGSLTGNTNTAHASGNLGQIQDDTMRLLSWQQGSVCRLIDTQTSSAAFQARVNGPLNVGYSLESENMSLQVTPYNGRSIWGGLKIDWSTVTPTSNENRPANVAVKWLIFAGE